MSSSRPAHAHVGRKSLSASNRGFFSSEVFLPWMSFAARLVAATVFAIAGISKVGDPQGTVRAVRAYRLVPEGAVHAVAYALPTFEIALAVLLVLGVATRVVGTVAATAVIVFIAAIASAGIRGLRIDCGCFGGGGAVTHTHYLLDIARDVLLLLVILVVPLAGRHGSRFALSLPRRRGGRARVQLLAAGGILAVGAMGGIVVNEANAPAPAVLPSWPLPKRRRPAAFLSEVRARPFISSHTKIRSVRSAASSRNATEPLSKRP